MMNDREDGQPASVLVINPGSTSTETGLFDVSGKGRISVLDHREDALEAFEHVLDQLEWREKEIARFIENEGVETGGLQAVVGRGGLLRPLAGGTYQVTDAMCADLEASRYGEHASNLGALLARRFSIQFNVPSYVVDPVTTDEFDPASRLSGVPGIERKCRNHALSIKAAARRVAKRLGKDLLETRLVAAHLGGGISICALRGGRIVDSTDALLGEGPFSPERAGTVPLAGMLALCLDGERSKAEIVKRLSTGSGLKGYLGTGRLPEVFRMIDQGNAEARLVLDAMVLQVGKSIGAMAAVLMGPPDAILLTGGMAHSERFVTEITSYVSTLAPLHVFPGSLEMEAMAEGAFRILNGQEDPLAY